MSKTYKGSDNIQYNGAAAKSRAKLEGRLKQRERDMLSFKFLNDLNYRKPGSMKKVC